MNADEISLGRYYAVSNPRYRLDSWAKPLIRVKIVRVAAGEAIAEDGVPYPLGRVLRTWADEDRRVKAIRERAQVASSLLGHYVDWDVNTETFKVRVTAQQLDRIIAEHLDSGCDGGEEPLSVALGFAAGS